MHTKRKILFIFGTRPEAIKLVSLIEEFKKEKEFFEIKICLTGQHQEMIKQVLSFFKIKEDYNLKLMRKNQTLASITITILKKLEKILSKENPDYLIVQGDTTTTFSASISAFYQKIPIIHIEAGLRTNNLQSPWPEELNRRVTTILSDLHFAPTLQAKKNLSKEGVNSKNIFITGNTVIDTLLAVHKKILSTPFLLKQLTKKFDFLNPNLKLLLVTGHRRENFGQGFKKICRAIVKIVEQNPNVEIIYPVHLNPNVRTTVFRYLNSEDKSIARRIHLIEPLDYIPFVYLMSRSYLILTDSGGVQEEAPSLGKPVLVLRNTTERPEAVKAGTVRLVGTDDKKIIYQTELLLKNPHIYGKMCKKYNPYGDGKAAQRIVKAIKLKLS